MRREEEINKKIEELNKKIEERKDDINDEIVPGSYFYDVKKVEELQNDIKSFEKDIEKLEAIPTVEKIKAEKEFLNEELEKVNEELEVYERGGVYFETEEMKELENQRKEIKEKIAKRDEILNVLTEIENTEKELEELHEEEKDYIGAYFIPDELLNEIKGKEVKLEELNKKLEEYTQERLGEDSKKVQEEVKKRMLVEKQKNSEMNNIANEKETVANEKNIDNDVETKAKKEKLDSLKTKENNETESKSENNGFRTYDTVNGFRVAKDNVKINEGEGKENLANEEVENEKIEKGNIDEIIINEGNGEVVISFKDGRKLNKDLNEILEEKKDTYIKENVKEICENIAGSKIRGLLLRTKINPAIIDVLSKYSDSDMIQEYVECLNEKRKMPFDLVHDLRDSKLGVINKLKMWVHAKAEDKIPGTKVTFAGMFWNKNKAIAEKSEVKNERESAEQTEAKRDKVQDRIKVDNKDNKLEHTANSNLDEKETQEKIAESVKEIMDEEKVL